MTNANVILLIGSVDCNDGVNTTLFAMTLGKPGRFAEEYGGPSIDIAAVGSVDTSQLVESRFTVDVSAASVDAVSAIVALIASEVRDLANITVGLQGSAYTGTLKVRIGECIEIPLDKPMDSALMNAHWTRVEIVVRREPWIYGAEETPGAGTALLPSFNPTGTTWPTGWERSGEVKNMAPHPGFELDTNADGLADGLTNAYAQTIAGAATYSRVGALGSNGLYAQRVQYTGVAGDAAGDGMLGLTDDSLSGTDGTVTPGDVLTLSALVEGALTGCVLKMYVAWVNSPSAWGGSAYSGALSVGATAARVAANFTVPAGKGSLIFGVCATDIGTGDIVDLSFDDMMLEKANTLTAPYFDGDSDADSRWEGTANASASYRYLWRATGDRFLVEEYGAGLEPQTVSIGVAVTPGVEIGLRCSVQGVEFTGGGHFYAGYAFYDSGGSQIGSATTFASTDATGAPVTLSGVVTVPGGAASVAFVGHLGGGTGLSSCYVWAVEIGVSIVHDSPSIMDLSDQTGQGAGPLDIFADAAALNLTSFYAGRYPTPVTVDKLVFGPAAILYWTAGTDAADANGYDPTTTGTPVHRHNAAALGYIDASQVEPGTYLVLARCKGTTANVDKISHQYGDDVLIPTTSLAWLSLGVLSLPNKLVYGSPPGSSALRFTITGGAGVEYAYLNAVALVPVSFGGMVGWKAASGHAHTVRWADGLFYVDELVSLDTVVGGLCVRSLGGCLLIVSESGGATTTLDVTLEATPRWEQLPA